MKRKLGWLIVLVIGAAVVVAYFLKPNRSSDYLSYNITTSLQHVSLDDIDRVMEPFVVQSFWEVDLKALKQALEQISWVQRATIKRSWPGYLEVELVEQQPVARWGDAALINREGEIFTPSNLVGFEQLIRLDGDVLQAKSLMEVWLYLQPKLASLGFEIQGLSQQVGGVYRVELDQQKTLLLDAKFDKLERFVRAYPQFSKKLVESAVSFDLRYSHGVAVKMASPQSN